MSATLAGEPVPRPLSARATEVVAMARQVLERDGAEALTMRRVAEDLDIRAPSIYKHLASKRAIEVALIELAFKEIGRALHEAIAGSTPESAIADLLRAYRRHGTAEPNLYRLALAGSLPRDELTPGLEGWAGEPFFLVTGEANLAQALWSFAHGMVVLEIDGRYPDGSDLDRTWAAGASAFRAATGRTGDQRI